MDGYIVNVCSKIKSVQFAYVYEYNFYDISQPTVWLPRRFLN